MNDVGYNSLHADEGNEAQREEKLAEVTGPRWPDEPECAAGLPTLPPTEPRMLSAQVAGVFALCLCRQGVMLFAFIQEPDRLLIQCFLNEEMEIVGENLQPAKGNNAKLLSPSDMIL